MEDKDKEIANLQKGLIEATQRFVKAEMLNHRYKNMLRDSAAAIFKALNQTFCWKQDVAAMLSYIEKELGDEENG